MTAAQWLDRLTANTDDFFADRITHAEHGRRGAALWAAIEVAGLKDEVCALWRQRTYGSR